MYSVYSVMGWIGPPHGFATCCHLRLLQALQLLHTMAINVEDLQASRPASNAAGNVEICR